jgi:hypothetical protein
VLDVFVIMEAGTRRIVHFNAHSSSADWTLQQFREVITGERPYRFLDALRFIRLSLQPWADDQIMSQPSRSN